MAGTTNIINLTNTAGTGGASFGPTPIVQLETTQDLHATQNGASVTYLYVAATNTWYRYSRG
jgi:hypothetical protein